VLLFAAGLVFLFCVTVILGLWWVSESRRYLRARLAGVAVTDYEGGIEIVRPTSEDTDTRIERILGRTGIRARLSDLALQAGYRLGATDFSLVVLAFAVIGGALTWLRTGAWFLGVIAAPVAGSLPVLYVLYNRSKRLRRLEAQFPDALDMISRAIRAGNALSGAIRLVGEEMPDPTAEEFRQVSEEIRLGLDPGEALFRLRMRAPTEDVRFFATAIKIQRTSGGNLAEVLDRLAEVIRERFKILSYARALSAQHRWSAICVGLSPIIMAFVFEMVHPGYLKPLVTDPIGPWLIGAGIVFEVVGFFTIWRIAQIKV
jgi:tight adherence protein B